MFKSRKIQVNPFLGWLTPDQIKLILNEFFYLTSFLKRESDSSDFINWINQKLLVDIKNILNVFVDDGESWVSNWIEEVWVVSRHIRKQHILERKKRLINNIYDDSARIYSLQNNSDFLQKKDFNKIIKINDMLKDIDFEWKWKSLRRKNPKDEELLKNIKIKKELLPNSLFWNETIYRYTLYLNDKEIGHANYVEGKDYISTVYIFTKYRRKGLATFLYDYIEKDQNIKLFPNTHTKEGIAFWKNRKRE